MILSGAMHNKNIELVVFFNFKPAIIGYNIKFVRNYPSDYKTLIPYMHNVIATQRSYLYLYAYYCIHFNII